MTPGLHQWLRGMLHGLPLLLVFLIAAWVLEYYTSADLSLVVFGIGGAVCGIAGLRMSDSAMEAKEEEGQTDDAA